MTVIVFDGVTIASDGLTTRDGRDIWSDAPKFTLVKRDIVATSGQALWGDRFEKWIANPRGKYPIAGKGDSETISHAAVIRPTGATLCYYSDEATPERYGSKWAIGSGYKYAQAALALGHDAVAACRVAMVLDPHCGMSLWYADAKELRKYGSGAIKRTEESGNGSPFHLPAKTRETGRALNASRAYRKGHMY